MAQTITYITNISNFVRASSLIKAYCKLNNDEPLSRIVFMQQDISYTI